jgi:hypothetical protein
MSDYGADKKPDLNIATETAFVQKLVNLPKTNVMQWTYPGGKIVQKYASRQGKTNLHISYQL